MKRRIRFLLLIVWIFVSFFNHSFAEINMIITPIRYELTLDPWERITKTAILRNKWEDTLYFTVWKTNVESDSSSWRPVFVKNWNPNQELASWINLKTNSLTIWPLSDYVVEFDINVPNDAVPWGHYWAVFFDYDSKTNWHILWAWKALNINANYWLLILVKVNWDLNEDWTSWWTDIWWWTWWTIWWGWNSWPWPINWEIWENDEPDLNSAPENDFYNPPTNKIDNCPMGDYSGSNYDSKCFDAGEIIKAVDFLKKDDNVESEDNLGDDNNFAINFNTPFENNWNTHIKPKWKIILKDEDWNNIEDIWVINILDENGNVVWKEIVDYLPINDEFSNVLPNTKRNFEYKRTWFPYKELDNEGKIIIKFKKPSEYYWDKIWDKLFPWQKKQKQLKRKKVEAITSLQYTKTNWEVVEINSAKEFYIEYEIECIKINIYFLICILLLLIILIILIYILKKILNINIKIERLEKDKKDTIIKKTRKTPVKKINNKK